MRILLFCVLAVLLAACNLIATPENVTEDVPNTAIPASDLTQTHTNQIIGISFNYPAGWFVDPNVPEDMVQLYSSVLPTPQPGELDSLPAGASRIDIAPLSIDAPFTTLDDYVAFFEQGGNDEGVTVEVVNRMTLDGDIPAARLQFINPVMGDVAVLAFELNGVIYSVNGHGDTGRFDEIIGTIRHADS